MPWNGSGSFTSVFNWEADAAAGINILASRMDTQEADYTSNGFGNTLTRDGQGQPTANLPMAGFKHTNLGNGSSSTDSVAFGQMQTTVQAGQLNWVASGGTHDAITATYSPAIGALTDGLVVFFRASAANLTTTPTFAPNGLTAETITKNGGQTLAVGDIPGNLVEVGLRYNLANTRWELLNPPSIAVGGCLPYFGGTLPSGYALPQGQNLAAATYPAANVVLSTTYGNPGGGNFTMPDVRGRTLAGLDEGGSGRITSAGGNFDGTGLGNAGGAQNQTIGQTNFPAVNFTNSGITTADSGHVHTYGLQSGTGAQGGSAISGGGSSDNTGSTDANVSITAQGHAASGGSGTALPSLGPTMVVNVMMRIA